MALGLFDLGPGCCGHVPISLSLIPCFQSCERLWAVPLPSLQSTVALVPYLVPPEGAGVKIRMRHRAHSCLLGSVTPGLFSGVGLGRILKFPPIQSLLATCHLFRLVVPLPQSPNLQGKAWYLLADLFVLKQAQRLWSEGCVPGALAEFFPVWSGQASRKAWFCQLSTFVAHWL